MIRRTILIGLLAIASLAAAGVPVAAKAGDVIERGQCSGASHWKLKLSPENGRIEAEFEVDQNRNGKPWRVTLKQNGTRVFRAVRYTQAPSGSFEVRRVLPNRAGADQIIGRAKNLRTGEICRGLAIAGF